MMSRQGVAALLLVFFPVALSTTCTVCMTGYNTEKTNAGTSNTHKCTALSTYLTCLDTSAKDDDGCPIPSADAGAIETDYTGASCSDSFTETCVCQKTFWGTVQADGTATCTEARKYLTCLKGKTTMTCDGTSSVATLTAGVETRMKALTGCTVSPACQCQINAMKADMSTDAKKCTAYKTQYACLYGLSTGDTCDTGTTLAALKTAAAASVTGATSCTFDDTCACQRSYDAAAKDNAAAQCTAYKTELNCLGAAKTSTGCDGSTTKSAIATTAETELAKLTTSSAATCPAVSPACQCQINAMKADMSTDAKKCTAYKTQYACLYGLSTGDTCDTGTTLAALKTAAAASVTGATSCTFDDTCACQRSYDAAAKDNAAAQCTAYKTELNCLGAAKTSTGCDGSTTKSAIATTAETELAKLTTSSAATCPAVSPACQCQINAMKADMSTDAKKCTAYKTQYACLYGLSTGDTCDIGTTLAALKTAAAASVTGATPCTFDDTCACQRSYDAAAKDNAAAQCTTYKAELNCLGAAKTSTGCDGSTTKSSIATTAETELAKLTTASAATCPAPTSTCQCEIATAKADNTKYCTVLKTMETCLSTITNTTEAGCTSTTQAALLTSTTEMYKTEKCAADHVTFVMTSLLVSLLASMFL